MPPTKPDVPLLDLQPEVDDLWDELNAAFQRVLRQQSFIMGPDVPALEAEIAHYLGLEHAIAVNSGTDALVIALRALGVGPGDEVITTAFTFFATAEAVTLLGATPVFVDIEPESFNLNVDQLEAAVTERTKAIIPVHLFGLPVQMDAVRAFARKHGLFVLEDVAQAMGARHRGQLTGTMGDIAAFSFFPSKNLGAYGDGGLIATSDDALAETCRMLRVHGARRKYFNEVAGYNSRLDTLQAAILRVKLPHLDRWNQARRTAAERYAELLEGLPLVLPTETPGMTHVYHQYTVRLSAGRRDAVQAALAEAGVGTMVYYPVPVHRLPLYQPLGHRLPEAEKAASEVLSLPMGPGLTADAQRRVAEALKDALG